MHHQPVSLKAVLGLVRLLDMWCRRSGDFCPIIYLLDGRLVLGFSRVCLCILEVLDRVEAQPGIFVGQDMGRRTQGLHRAF